ncbi:3-alpha-hydroxysteroid sulfotransferase isoform X1 [Dermacentor silvarum]|nr:3-alpha-hydroxysteroid sulfotransferase isoform X1 [Dermacentor silvarum]
MPQAPSATTCSGRPRRFTLRAQTEMTSRRPYRQIIDGVPRCAFLKPDIFRKNLSFRAADGDLIQSTYVKCGTHYVHYITQLILKRGEPVKTYQEFTSNTRLIEYMDSTDWKSALPLRLFLTHLPLRRDTMNPKAKYVYVARNPWDAAVSLFRMVTDMSIYRFQDGTFEEFLGPFMEGDLGYGDYFDHVASGYALKDKPNVFFVTYEELKEDTRNTVLKLAHFLGESYGCALEEDEEVLEKVLEWSKPENMRKVIVFDLAQNPTSEWHDLFVRNNVSSKCGYLGDKTKYSLVKEAKIGSWREYFTPSQLTCFEKKIQDQGHKASFMELWKDIRDEAIALSSGRA